MFQDNENSGDFDGYCGYTPPSKLEEATGHYQKSPDSSSNLDTLQPVPQGNYSLHTMQPMQYQHLRDPAANLSSEGSLFSQHTMQSMPYQELWDPSSYLRVSEGSAFSHRTLQPISGESPFSLHTMQPMQYQHLRDPVANLSSNGSPFSQHTMQSMQCQELWDPSSNLRVSEGSPFRLNKTFDFESSLPKEFGEEFTENLGNTSRRQELSYASLPYCNGHGPNNWDGFFSTNEKYFDDCLKDMYDRDDNEKGNGEVEPKKFEKVLEKPDDEKIDYRDCVKRVTYDNVDDSMRTDLNESSESNDSEEEELIVIDSDTDDDDEIGELSEKYEIYCEYPVRKCNTVIVSETDYRSLECSKFLNDIIIDFYLNYIFVDILPVEHQSRVHVFSTIFYKRLLQMPNKKRKNDSFEEDVTVPMAEKRHRRVSGWTKNVDLFSKSVLLIPICENSHWYLLMVVGLSGVASSPFILVLDSLGGLRNRAAGIIRQYLACEYEAKQMEGNLSFSDVEIPSVRPAKPEQPNGTDCGVYLLHYAEKIFKSIQNFLSPNLPCLKNWFSHEEVAKKRSDIAHLIRNLAKEQKSDNDLQFPDISFTLEKDPEVDDGMELDVEKVKSVDDFRNRLEHFTHQNSVKNSEMSKEIVGSEIKKTSSSRKRVVRKKIEKMTCSGDSKSPAPSTSTSRGFPLPEKNPITQTESEVPSSYCKSYSKGFKIPRIKKSDSTTKQSAPFPTETGQTLPTSDDEMSGTDSIIGKLAADEPKFHAVLGSSESKIGAVARSSKSEIGATTGSSKSEIGAATGSSKSEIGAVTGSSKSKIGAVARSSKPEIGATTGSSKSEIGAVTATSCPVYGDRCESAYHLHPKVKNLTRKSRNGVNSTGASLGNDRDGEVSSGVIDGQYVQNRGMKKCNIVATGSSKSEIGALTGRSKSPVGALTDTSCPVYGDRCPQHSGMKKCNIVEKFLTGASETSDV